MAPLREAAGRFCPPYEISEDKPYAMLVRLRDPTGRRPDLALRHRHERRLFLKANYLRVTSTVPGQGPSEDGELTFRFFGPLKRQRFRLRWKKPVPEGSEWLERLEPPLRRAVEGLEAVQKLSVAWSAKEGSWRLTLETMSGSMVSGFMTLLPIAVPFDAREAKAILAMMDALAAARV